MYEVAQMKGTNKVLIRVLTDSSALTLHQYADGSTNITRNGKLLGVWEPAECEDCYSAFVKFLARDHDPLTPIPVCSHFAHADDGKMN
jgi:hypothetical protein